MADPTGFRYFDLQAYVGTTKHMGGLETTKELIQLCRIGRDTYVLDVGCGVGATACYLAKVCGCQVVGVDLHESMVARAHERAQREGVQGKVEFKVADAQHLPFEDTTFDVLLCESVVTFIADKRRVAHEYARVLKPEGYVGLNEEIWIQTPPPPEVAAFVKRAWEIDSEVLTADEWVEILNGAGFRDVQAHVCEFDPRRESSQVKRYHWGELLTMAWRSLSLYARNPAFRRYMQARRHLPKGLFQYLGYGIFVARR